MTDLRKEFVMHHIWHVAIIFLPFLNYTTKDHRFALPLESQ
jgi:hypothetical protein